MVFSNLKEEYMNMMSKNNLSPSSSNANDSDTSRYFVLKVLNFTINRIIQAMEFSFSFKDSNMSYDMKQQSDDNTNLSFSWEDWKQKI